MVFCLLVFSLSMQSPGGGSRGSGEVGVVVSGGDSGDLIMPDIQ